MALSNLLDELGGLKKLTIIAYEDEDYKEEAPTGRFEVMYNPNTYSQEYKNAFVKTIVKNKKEILTFEHSKSETISFEFLFDGTGTSVSGSSNMADNILKRDKGRTDKVIAEFLKMTQEIDGTKHRPRFLILSWGELTFKGFLESATVTHKLFDPSGLPIRSTLNCSFRSHDSLKKQAAKAKLNSPDLTHYKLVEAHHSLPLLSNSIYKSTEHYLEIARVNRLNNFRRLRPGNRLAFPPIDKTD